MSDYTDWFIANEEDAEEVAQVESAPDNFPNLTIHGIIEIDLMELWAILQNKKSGAKDSVTSKLLFQDEEGVFVAQVSPEFLTDLIQIEESEVETVAESWRSTEGLTDYETSNLVESIKQMSAFAKQAQQANKIVLNSFSV